MKKPIQAVIFDLDGTLLNTLGDLRNAVNYALRRRGWPERTTEEVCAFVGNGIRNLMRLSMPEGMPDDVIDAGLAEFYEYYSAHMQDETVPYDGIMELLRQLKADGVKHLAVCLKATGSRSVYVVAGYGMLYIRHMYAYLMSAARFELHLQKRIVAESMQHAPVRHRLPAASVVNYGHSLSVRPVASYRRIDSTAVLLQVAVDERYIRPVRRVLGPCCTVPCCR